MCPHSSSLQSLVCIHLHLGMHSYSLVRAHLHFYSLTFTCTHSHSLASPVTEISTWSYFCKKSAVLIRDDLNTTVRASVYKWRWVNTSEGRCPQEKVGEYSGLRAARTSEGECIQVNQCEFVQLVKMSVYKWRWAYYKPWMRVNTSEGECAQVKLSAYKWRWVRAYKRLRVKTSEGECAQVNLIAYKWRRVRPRWVNTSEGEFIPVNWMQVKYSLNS